MVIATDERMLHRGGSRIAVSQNDRIPVTHCDMTSLRAIAGVARADMRLARSQVATSMFRVQRTRSLP